MPLIYLFVYVAIGFLILYVFGAFLDDVQIRGKFGVDELDLCKPIGEVIVLYIILASKYVNTAARRSDMKPVEINQKATRYVTGDKPAKELHLKLFRHLAALPDNESPLEKALLILCTPRSGSTFFSEALNACGKLGYCEEWFNYEYFDAWSQVTEQDFSLQNYVEWVSKKSLRNTGVLTMKWHIGQLVAMNQDYNLGIESMDFSHVVYVYRRDKIAQAVSLVKALATGRFRSTEKARGKYQMSRQGIAEGLSNTIKFDQFTQSYLKQYINKSYTYEDFCEAPHVACNEVLEALGKSPCDPEAFKVTTIKKQSDQRNIEAIEDFRRYILGEIE
jgi:LPS sulfotransferase NodH